MKYLDKRAYQIQLHRLLCKHFSEEFPSKKALLALDLGTPRVGNLDAWFNSYSDFSGCRIPGFENRALISFYCHALNPNVVAEVSFYKTCDFVQFKIIFIFKI